MKSRDKQVRYGTLILLAGLMVSLTPVVVNLPGVAQTMTQSVEQHKAEGDRLLQQGIQQYRNSQYEAALKSWQQALAADRSSQNLSGEANALMNLGTVYLSLLQYDKATIYYQQALVVFGQVGDRLGQAQVLNNLGILNISLQRYDKVRDYYQQALSIQTALHDRSGQANAFVGLGIAYRHLKQPMKAISSYQKALILFEVESDRDGQANTLTNLGLVYSDLRQYDKAVTALQQALLLSQTIENRNGQAKALASLADVYYATGQYSEAIHYYQQAFALYERASNQEGQSNVLLGLGLAYSVLGQYSKAIEFNQQALAASQKLENYLGEVDALNNLGVIYDRLGQYSQAIESYQQALTISQKTSNLPGQETALRNLGRIYTTLGNDSKAVECQQQALKINRQLDNALGEAGALGNLGIAYHRLKRYSEAVESLLQALALDRRIGNRLGISSDSGNLGNVYFSLQQYSKAVDFYQQALAAAREIGSRENEAMAFSSMGTVLVKLVQPELAVVFYKQSVNTYEAIRNELRKNPQVITLAVQASYTEAVANTYRRLAGLLLQQDRVMEALQVLDLLKVQDLQDFLKDVKGNALTTKGLELLPQEEALLQTFNASSQRSLNTFLQDRTIQTQVQTLQRTAAAQDLTLNAYQDLQTRIKKLGNHIALFYPLILDDRLELVILTNDRPPIHKPVPISRQQLTSEVETFRQQLQMRSPLVQQPAQQLYQHLIQPIESELRAAGVTTIVYAPDSVLRYVPLAALHDGKQWLAQRYQITYLTALALTPLDPAPTQTPHVLAGAVTRSYSPIVNGQKYPFPALSQTQAEVEQLAQRYPNTQLLIDDRLNRRAIETNLEHSTIVHLATHAAFVSGSPDASFILLGDGSTLSLRDLNDLKLPNVSLFVLSACETALGEKLGNGIEIFGFGYQLQRNRVRASLASLWKVSDGGTQVLMNRFYTALKQGKTIAEAMQQAQRGFIDHQVTPQEAQQLRASGRAYVEGGIPVDFTHPYYWASFILIGNGL